MSNLIVEHVERRDNQVHRFAIECNENNHTCVVHWICYNRARCPPHQNRF